MSTCTLPQVHQRLRCCQEFCVGKGLRSLFQAPLFSFSYCLPRPPANFSDSIFFFSSFGPFPFAVLSKRTPGESGGCNYFPPLASSCPGWRDVVTVECSVACQWRHTGRTDGARRRGWRRERSGRGGAGWAMGSDMASDSSVQTREKIKRRGHENAKVWEARSPTPRFLET